jgi:hypothetical protein
LAAFAVAFTRLSYSDFYALTPRQFFSLLKAQNIKNELTETNNLKLVRWVVSTLLNPHLKKSISPEELLPLDIDNKEKEKELQSLQEKVKNLDIQELKKSYL